jgi:hypothetical protein
MDSGGASSNEDFKRQGLETDATSSGSGRTVN